MPGTEALFERVAEAIASKSIQRAIIVFRDAYSLAHVTLHMAQTLSDDVHMPYLKTTYPSNWVSRYVLKGYVNVDPVVAMGFNRQLPFDWREVEHSPEADALMADSRRFGLGGNGYSIPVVDKSGRRTLVSLNSRLEGSDWDIQTEKSREEWAELAHFLHRRAIIDRYGSQDPAPQLGPREHQCLTLAAKGYSSKRIAMKLHISEHTARDYLKSLRRKLGCTSISQAIAKAYELGIIRSGTN